MVGEVLEDVSGQWYADYIGDTLLNPLEIDRSTFDPDVFEATPDRMTPISSGTGARGQWRAPSIDSGTLRTGCLALYGTWPAISGCSSTTVQSGTT